MSRDDCLKYEGALDANQLVNGIDDVLRLATKLDDYTVLHGGQYGKRAWQISRGA
jgi:hypothetical protein